MCRAHTRHVTSALPRIAAQCPESSAHRHHVKCLRGRTQDRASSRTHAHNHPTCIHAQFRRDTTLSRSTGALVSQPTDAQYRSSTLWHSWVQAQTRQNPTCTGRQCYPGFSRTARPRGGAATSITISNRVRHSYTTEGAHRWCCGRKRRATAAIVPTTRISPTSPAARMPTLESSH